MLHKLDSCAAGHNSPKVAKHQECQFKFGESRSNELSWQSLYKTHPSFTSDYCCVNLILLEKTSFRNYGLAARFIQESCPQHYPAVTGVPVPATLSSGHRCTSAGNIILPPQVYQCRQHNPAATGGPVPATLSSGHRWISAGNTILRRPVDQCNSNGKFGPSPLPPTSWQYIHKYIGK